MGQQHGLCPLKMRVTGKNQPDVLFRKIHQGDLRLFYKRAHSINGVPHIKTHIQGHLIVSAPAGVELLSHRADALDQGLLHKGVDILLGFIKGEYPLIHFLLDPFKGLDDPVPLFFRDDSFPGQHAAVGHAALDVLPIETPVKTE